MTDQTAKKQADSLMERLLRGKDVHDSFSASMRRQLLISGQPIDHWENKFKISIPTDNLNPSTCKEIGTKLMDLNQEASFYQAVAAAKVQLIKRGSESQIMGRVAAIVEEYKNDKKRTPAASTIETLAKYENDDLESALSIANVEARFWKDVLDHLATCRKLLENATLNISVELKALNAEQMVDAMQRRMNSGG